MKIEGFCVIPDMYVSDVDWVDRTLYERFFTRPWQPFKKRKCVEHPRAYLMQDKVYVSHVTFIKLKNDLLVRKTLRDFLKNYQAEHTGAADGEV